LLKCTDRERSPLPPREPLRERERSPLPFRVRDRSPLPPRERERSPLPPRERDRSPLPPRDREPPPRDRERSPLPPRPPRKGKAVILFYESSFVVKPHLHRHLKVQGTHTILIDRVKQRDRGNLPAGLPGLRKIRFGRMKGLERNEEKSLQDEKKGLVKSPPGEMIDERSARPGRHQQFQRKSSLDHRKTRSGPPPNPIAQTCRPLNQDEKKGPKASRVKGLLSSQAALGASQSIENRLKSLLLETSASQIEIDQLRLFQDQLHPTSRLRLKVQLWSRALLIVIVTALQKHQQQLLLFLLGQGQ
jgi:hypothetical protein